MSELLDEVKKWRNVAKLNAEFAEEDKDEYPLRNALARLERINKLIAKAEGKLS